jgi:hypothetical protein
VEPATLSLGESEAGPVTRRITIENDGPVPVTYTLSPAPALSTGPNTFSPQFLTNFATVEFSAPTVTVRPRHRGRVDVTITANPMLLDRGLYGGYIALTSSVDGAVFRVPYTGFKGDYQSIRVLTPTASGFPWLAKLQGDSFFNQPAGRRTRSSGTTSRTSSPTSITRRGGCGCASRM